MYISENLLNDIVVLRAYFDLQICPRGGGVELLIPKKIFALKKKRCHRDLICPLIRLFEDF